MSKIIETENLSKSFKSKVATGKTLKDMFKPDYRDVHAVKNISFSIDEGESVAFLGPNGAGKTTTMKMLSGLLFPTNGIVEVLGYTPFDRKREFLSQIGLIMGNKAGLNWDLTSEQSFGLLKQIYRISNTDYKERVDHLTDLLDVRDFLNIQVRKLSLGQRMKLELIGAILHNPKILFLDEPTIGLDVIAKQRVRSFLREIQKEFKTTLLLTSHDMDDVERVCERVLIIDKGSIILDDDIVQLMDKYQKDRYVKVIFKKEITSAPTNKYEIVNQEKNSVTYQIPSANMANLINEISNSKDLHDIDIVSTPLEEIIADIFENGRSK